MLPFQNLWQKDFPLYLQHNTEDIHLISVLYKSNVVQLYFRRKLSWTFVYFVIRKINIFGVKWGIKSLKKNIYVLSFHSEFAALNFCGIRWKKYDFLEEMWIVNGQKRNYKNNLLGNNGALRQNGTWNSNASFNVCPKSFFIVLSREPWGFMFRKMVLRFNFSQFSMNFHS